MGFRERSEYKEWRGAVFQLFGRKCILCGHTGNLHAHHVLPVNTYPELAFDPHNGAPLCGNCHTEVNGNESAYLDELRQRQRDLLADDSLEMSDLCEDLRLLAEEHPSDPARVQEWLARTTDHEAVSAFYESHGIASEPNAELYLLFANHLVSTGRIDRCDDACNILRDGLSRFHENPQLHVRLAEVLLGISTGAEPGEECWKHAEEACKLSPTNPRALNVAATAAMRRAYDNTSLRYANRLLDNAQTDLDRLSACSTIAWIYYRVGRHRDAIPFFKKILTFDPENESVGTALRECMARN